MKTVIRTWIVNGKKHTVEFPPMRRLLDVIREILGLKGTKEGCGEGECGACSILLNHEPVTSCLIAAGQVPDGAEILTIEGLELTHEGQELQRMYVAKGAAQCGFCIPGMLVASYAHVTSDHPDNSDAALREAHAGNICRCTGYAKIIEAVSAAAERLSHDDEDDDT
ncbi:MAG: (2Fe-2S)-binding protein [Kiritimatiellae bacterium]|nr:(2Fe-2S)-binding protein [Kiritimatiellia bacterium]MCO5067861.1 (2Fe-2S)-binding protein [Kiritimatiellia bacterium]